MQLENQVISLEFAKQLKEAGVPQESYFIWITFKKLEPTLREGKVVNENEFSAFTVAELGEMLPVESRTTKLGADGWIVRCESYGDAFVRGETEAEARAKMLLYLINQKLVKF